MLNKHCVLLLGALYLQHVIAARSVSQVHLGLTSECSNGVSLSFASSSAEPFRVTYGGQNVQTQSTTYSFKDYTSPYLHTVALCNLKPNTVYTYSIEDKFSASFRALPPVGEETVLGIVGDFDFQDKSINNLLKPYNNKNSQALLVVGDWSYANGDQKKWDKWFDLQSPTFSKLPVTGINGNHEVTVKNEKYTAYLNRMPGPISKANKNAFRTYYSVDIGLVHAVFLDDYVGALHSVGSKNWLNERNMQLQWLQKDLASVDRSKTPYVIVLKHNPFYNTFDDHQCKCGANRFEIGDINKCWSGSYDKAKSEPHCGLQAKFEDVYASNNVQVVFAGHCHGYERTMPIYKNQINNNKGVVYITTGAGGRGHAGSRISSIPKWSAFAEGDVYGASRLIATREKMQVLWFGNDDLRQPLDKVEIYSSKFEGVMLTNTTNSSTSSD